MTLHIMPARSASDIADVTRLVCDFVGFLKDRYPERADQIDDYLKHQRFEEMLADFPKHFLPPAGECMLAQLDGMSVGIVMLKRVDDSLCEMNRMYVSPAARGHGVGRALCNALLDAARELGYRDIRLGALHRHHEALPLYHSLGFKPDPDPPEFARDDPHVVHLRMTVPPA